MSMSAPDEAHSYLICAAPRTGSSPLCWLLESSGIAGHHESYLRQPDELFHSQPCTADLARASRKDRGQAGPSQIITRYRREALTAAALVLMPAKFHLELVAAAAATLADPPNTGSRRGTAGAACWPLEASIGAVPFQDAKWLRLGNRAMSPASARILAAAGRMPWTSIRLDPVARTAGFSSAFMALSLVSSARSATDPDQGDEHA
jgi:hypothetical protein